MKKLLALTLLASILGTTTAGCIFGCGAAPYDGDGQVFGSDASDASSDGSPATTSADGATTPATAADGGSR